MLKDTQNKYVRERRDSLKKTCYMIRKNNFKKMRVESFWKESVHSRWYLKKLTYVKTAMGILLLVTSKALNMWANYLKGLLNKGGEGEDQVNIVYFGPDPFILGSHFK